MGYYEKMDYARSLTNKYFKMLEKLIIDFVFVT